MINNTNCSEELQQTTDKDKDLGTLSYQQNLQSHFIMIPYGAISLMKMLIAFLNKHRAFFVE